MMAEGQGEAGNQEHVWSQNRLYVAKAKVIVHLKGDMKCWGLG